MRCISAVVALVLVGESSAGNLDANAKNLASIEHLCAGLSEMVGAVSEAAIEIYFRLNKELYAPKIDCEVIASSKEFGYNLQGVSIEACMGEDAKKYAGLKMTDYKCEDITQDKIGKTFMVYSSAIVKMPVGQPFRLPMFSRYQFNNDGKIVAYNTEFDTSAFFPATAAAKNAATVRRECRLNEELAGQRVTTAMMDRVSDQVKGHYAPKVDCYQVPTSKEFGYSLRGVPVSACNAETAKQYGGIQIIAMKCNDIAADEDGKAVMFSQSSTFKLTTGQTVQLPIFSKYNFNEAGQIVAMTTEYDTSAFSSSSIRLSASLQPWSPFLGLVFSIGFLVAVSMMYTTMKCRKESHVQEPYHLFA